MIELHTVPTANGYKVSIMLEEIGLPYSVHPYDLVKGEHQAPGYLSMNPVGRLPLIVDREAGSGGPATIYGTAAILQYLAEKSGRLMPKDLAARGQVWQWLGIISSDVAPAYTGQFVFNMLAPEKLPWAIEFYNNLVLRMLKPLELQLSRTRYLAGDEYTIADIIAYPVAATSAKRFPGNLETYPALSRWAAEVGARPAVQKGMKIPA